MLNVTAKQHSQYQPNSQQTVTERLVITDALWHQAVNKVVRLRLQLIV